ncbi:MAG: hypothetical protein IJ043_09325 [Clostridia bacterium]|nr:hypothetical protein [Clostridia bacterium]
MKVLADVHVHNFLSNCGRDNTSTAANYVKRYAELGIKILGFANHIWDDRVPGASSWYHKQTLDFSMQIKPMIPKDTLGVKVLVGAETEYCGMSKTLGMSAEGAKELDFLLIPHSHVHMVNFVMEDPAPYAEARLWLKAQLMQINGMTEEQAESWVAPLREPLLRPFLQRPFEDWPAYLADFLVESFDSLMDHPELHKILQATPVSIAHPFQPVGYWQHTEALLGLISDETFARLFKKAADLGVGLEINTHCNNPAMLRMLTIAKDQGCKFTFGSDTHSISGAENIFNVQPAVDALGLTEDDLMDFIK